MKGAQRVHSGLASFVLPLLSVSPFAARPRVPFTLPSVPAPALGRAELKPKRRTRPGERLAIAGYLGRKDVFDQAIADFSAAYAEQNERDYNAFAAAVKSGRLRAETGL